MIISESIEDLLFEYNIENKTLRITDRDQFENLFDSEDIKKLKFLFVVIDKV